VFLKATTAKKNLIVPTNRLNLMTAGFVFGGAAYSTALVQLAALSIWLYR